MRIQLRRRRRPHRVLPQPTAGAARPAPATARRAPPGRLAAADPPARPSDGCSSTSGIPASGRRRPPAAVLRGRDQPGGFDAGPPARRGAACRRAPSAGAVNANDDAAGELLVKALDAALIDDPPSASPPPSNYGSDAESKENRGAERQQAGAQPLGPGDACGHLHGEEHADDQVTQPRHPPHPASMRPINAERDPKGWARLQPPVHSVDAHAALVARRGQSPTTRGGSLSGARSAREDVCCRYGCGCRC
jgi:hypothetical protein